MTSLPAAVAQRKALGAWYTPASLARLLVTWALRAPGDHVLDPAVGDGVFLVEAARCLRTYGGGRKGHQLHGVDVNPEAVAWTIGAVEDILGSSDGPDVRLASFFELEPPTGLLSDLPYVDAVVGNPPYIRYQSFAGRGRASGLSRAARQGVRLTSLSSAWAPFVIHATSFLKQGGRLALVLPEELIHASYARPVREFLRKTFQSTNVVRFENHRFPGAQERVVLLLAEGKDITPAGELRLASLVHPGEVSGLQHVLATARRFAPLAGPGKWDPDFDDPAAALVEQLVASGCFVPLRRIGKAGIGYVSGANDFFVFTPSRADGRRFPRRLLTPTIAAARQLPGAVVSRQDVDDMIARDEQCLLWEGDGAGHPAVDAYIAEGARDGIARRYKCRMRHPWYVIPGVYRPDAFLTYMSDEIPRLVLNRAGITCSNTLLGISLNGIRARVRPAFVASFYNSATMVSAERVGRRYGGGVLKLEPSEADRLCVPNPDIVMRTPQTGGLLRQVDRFIRGGLIDSALALIDGRFLREACGLGMDDIAELQASRARRQAVRRGKT